MKRAPKTFDAALLGELVGLALRGTGYVPTLSSPEQKPMADAFDAARDTITAQATAHRHAQV